MADAVPCLLRRAAEAHPERWAFRGEPGSLTFAACDAQVADLARRYDALGVTCGSRVALCDANGIDWLLACFALWRCGAVVYPLSLRLPPAAVRERVTRMDMACVRGAAAPFEGLPVRCLPPPDGGTPVSPGGDATWRAGAAAWVETSGSSGEPRVARLAPAALRDAARSSAQGLALGPDDAWLLSLPLHHVGGLCGVLRTWWSGGCVVLPPAGVALAAAIRLLEPTHVSVVQTQLRRWLATPGGVASGRLRGVVVGGGPVDAAVLAAARAAGLPVRATWGMTETCAMVTLGALDTSLEALGSSGAPLPGRELRVDDAGEICVRGAGLFDGYAVPAGGDASPPDADGWFRTGDLGRIDGAGRLWVDGRRDARFVSGGENIQPEAIERVLRGAGGCVEAIVVPVSDPEYGQRPFAFVRPAAGAVDVAALDRAVRCHLPGFMAPVRYEPFPDGSAEAKPSRPGLAARAARLSGP